MKVLPVVYCIEVKEGLVGQLYKNQLHKSIKQLQLMADKAQKKLDIYVMSFSKADCPADCKWIDATEINNICKQNLKINRVKSYSSFWRLFCPYMKEFSNIDKLLYVDTDTWCINKAFFSIFDYNLANNDCAAVRDIVIKNTESKRIVNYFKKILEDIRLMQLENCIYINSGVLLLSCNNIRSHFTCIDMLLAKISDVYSINDLVYGDQDIINILFRIRDISYRFNTLVNAKSSNYDFEKWLLHFTGNVLRHEQYNDEFPDFRLKRFKQHIIL